MTRHLTPCVPRSRRSESGYVLLMILFLGAALAIAAAAVAPSIVNQHRRELEEETIWRGEQYARAVRLYYKKNGRFPGSLDDLIKPGPGKVRYLRQEYKDPMNKEDGSWRILRVGPGGQLLGSARQRPGGFSLFPPTGTTPPAKSSEGSPTPTDSQQPTPATQIASPFGSDSPATGPIIGVASKNPRYSIKVYNGGTTYKEWEFFWDPSKDVATGVPGQPGTPQQPGQPQQNPRNPPPRP